MGVRTGRKAGKVTISGAATGTRKNGGSGTGRENDVSAGKKQRK